MTIIDVLAPSKIRYLLIFKYFKSMISPVIINKINKLVNKLVLWNIYVKTRPKVKHPAKIIVLFFTVEDLVEFFGLILASYKTQNKQVNEAH